MLLHLEHYLPITFVLLRLMNDSDTKSILIKDVSVLLSLPNEYLTKCDEIRVHEAYSKLIILVSYIPTVDSTNRLQTSDFEVYTCLGIFSVPRTGLWIDCNV